MYRLINTISSVLNSRKKKSAHCGLLKELRPPAADSFSDSMHAEAATIRDNGGRRYPKSWGQQAPPPHGGESWGVVNGGSSVAGPENRIPKKGRGAANDGPSNATTNLWGGTTRKTRTRRRRTKRRKRRDKTIYRKRE